MNEDLRVKEYEKEKNDAELAVRIKGSDAPLEKSENKRKIVFREMWADAFMHKKGELAEPKEVSVKKKAPSPYVYLRIAALYVIAIIILLTVFYFFDFHELYPIICLLVGTFVPFVCLIFFFELDTNDKIGIGMTIFLFFIASGIFLGIRFLAVKFVIELNDTVNFLGSLLVGGIEVTVSFLFIFLMVKSLKIKDVITGCYLGAIVGTAFAVMNNIIVCFNSSYSQTAAGYDFTLVSGVGKYSFSDVFNNMITAVTWDCVPRSVASLLTGCIFGGFSVYAGVTEERMYVVVLYYITILLGGFVFTSLWYVSDISSAEYIVYGLRILHIVCAIIVSSKIIRYGLSKNKYEL